MTLTDNARIILDKRYLLKGSDGEILESPEGMNRRVAKAIAAPEPEFEERFLVMLEERDFLPNSPTLFNAGTGQGSLSACFVLNPEDNMESIEQVDHDLAFIQKWGGGTGFGFSRLRPKGSPISTTHGKACGPVAVLKKYAATSEMITQGGKRNGANMGMLHIDHADIREFIHMKDDGVTAQNFNISVLATDDFMERVKARDPEALGLFKEISASAWETGDPGLGFIDRVNNSTYRTEEDIEASNPCGEEWLENYGSCNLGSINLSHFVLESKDVDWPRLGEIARLATRFLNNVIEVNEFPVKKLDEVNKRTKRIGLGVMGWHDMLLLMRIPYGSEASFTLAEKVMQFITERALEESAWLGHVRGYVSPEVDRRNTSVTTIAPTGSIAALAGCSFGIEPVMAWRQEKHILDGEVLIDTHPLYEQARQEGWYTPELFATAHEIPWALHIRMQAAFQRHTTNSISKTINLPHEASQEDIEQAYFLAWEMGCKGITVYRDGSKATQVLYDADKKAKDVTGLPTRPKRLHGFTDQVQTGDGNIYVTYNPPLEIFATRGKGGTCDAAYIEGLTRIVSLALRRGVDSKEIASQLAGITCHPIPGGALSVPDAIAQLLAAEEDFSPPAKRNGNLCPDCQEPLIHQEGCETCPSCGYSRC
jgi:ribonucleoside-diphosphate reductase alpha chain